MSKLVNCLGVLIIIFSTSCKEVAKDSSASRTSVDGTPEILFSSMEHSFGRITEGEKVGTIFEFTNNGTGNLVIASASTSCGCTVPKFSSEPVAPGGKGTVEVVFDSSGREGQQSKTITIRSNASHPVLVLRITAEIITNIK